jgi:hypothetical protein
MNIRIALILPNLADYLLGGTVHRTSNKLQTGDLRDELPKL